MNEGAGGDDANDPAPPTLEYRRPQPGSDYRRPASFKLGFFVSFGFVVFAVASVFLAGATVSGWAIPILALSALAYGVYDAATARSAQFLVGLVAGGATAVVLLVLTVLTICGVFRK